MKKIKLFLVALLAVVAFACEDNSNIDPTGSLGDDDQLITAIEAATNKELISDVALPSSSTDALKQEYFDSYVATAHLAPELGYEVAMRREKGASIGEVSQVYFDLNGRPLKRKRKDRGECKSDKERVVCFEFVFPISLNMPDGSTITADGGRELGAAIKEWYAAHPDSRVKPEPVFPITLLFEDGEKVIESAEDMRAVRDYCYGENKDKEPRCFELVFPVTVIMSDGSTITGADKEDLMRQCKAWAEANPDARKKRELQFPVDVIMKDGTTHTIANKDEFHALKERCE